MATQAMQTTESAGADLIALSGRANDEFKLAHRVAVMLQHQIISDGLKDGCSLGTAAAIRARYNVGRWAFREALGILELRGVARLRSGPGGGVIVTEPDLVDLVDLTLLYLYANRSGPQEINGVRRSVLTAVVRQLLDSLPEADKFSAIDRSVGFSRFLARMTGNGALELAIEFVEWVRTACATQELCGGDEAEREAALWLAISRGDKDAALHMLDDYLNATERSLADTWNGLPALSSRRTGSGKLAYRLALQMLKDVVEHPDAPGDTFGSEMEIGIRFNANGEIVRQAIRLIEDLGLFTPRRGRNGGVVLRAPDTTSIATLIPHLLAQNGVSLEDCFEAGRYLEDEIARLAARQVRAAPQAACSRLDDDEMDLRGAMLISQKIHAYAASPLLLSIERAMGFYSYSMGPPVDNGPLTSIRIVALSRRVLEAVENGDVEGASAANRERFDVISASIAANAASRKAS